jgi:hypothetical protein
MNDPSVEILQKKQQFILFRFSRHLLLLSNFVLVDNIVAGDDQ